MCNFIHKEHKVLEQKEGIGYKLFTGHLSLVREMAYTSTRSGWTNWHKNYSGDGFVFFLDKNEALKAFYLWIGKDEERAIHTQLWEIQYKRGLVEQVEYFFMGDIGWNIALCKSFKKVEQIVIV